MVAQRLVALRWELWLPHGLGWLMQLQRTEGNRWGWRGVEWIVQHNLSARFGHPAQRGPRPRCEILIPQRMILFVERHHCEDNPQSGKRVLWLTEPDADVARHC